MKKLLSVLFLFTVLMASNVEAQSKIGWVNSAELIELLPETAGIKSRIKSFGEKKQNQLAAMQNELQTKYSAYTSTSATLTDVQRKVKEDDIRSLEGRIQEFVQKSQQELMENEQKELKPLFSKVQTAIDAVAKEKAYDYVIDAASNTGLFVYTSEKNNLTAAVKTKLGL
jgi:outer membrane protein